MPHTFDPRYQLCPSVKKDVRVWRASESECRRKNRCTKADCPLEKAFGQSLWTCLRKKLFSNKPRWRESGPPTFERKTASKPQRMKDGFIWCEGMLAPRPCTIGDMSSLEAEVTLWNDDVKPSLLRRPLKLFSCANQREVDCTLAGRQGPRLGLRFLSGLHAPTRKYSQKIAA